MSQNKRLSNTQSSSLSKRLSGTPVAAGEDEDATQPSTSQVERSLKKLLPAQIDQKTAEVVEYILVKDQKKIPIRRGDLVKHVIKEYRNVYPEIMKRAAHTFEQVFGLKLVNIDAKNQLYILINKLEAIAGGPSFSSPDPKMGLLFVILSVIFMKRGVAKEALIWSVLGRLCVDPAKRHEEFGDVKKMVTDEFVRQRYLEYVPISHTDPLEHNFLWGLRANVEVSKAKILQFVAELHDLDPQSWTSQYREAHNTQDNQLVPLGVATARHPFPCKPISCILLSNTKCPHVFPHDIHQPSLWSSSSSLAWQLHPHHPSTNILTISPLDAPKPSKSALSNFVSKTSNLACPSDELISNFIQPGHSESEPQHLHFRHLQFCFLLSLQCHCL
ncbi:necdin-like 2 isoform X2 [Phycodurus eques]|uniref:necdin-like 2 isoform X2 n=1 Tax=Phycodurus eques TaxID=693459 RepID=UPI002ACDB6A1|nr:necdin-like 2 isoform X2 [Phycodurus eques]